MQAEAKSYIDAASSLFSSITRVHIMIILIVIAFGGLLKSYLDWKRHRAGNNAGRQMLDTVTWAFVFTLSTATIIYCFLSIFGTTPSGPIIQPTEKIIYVTYEPYPSVPDILCPDRGQPCRPPNLFALIQADVSGRSLNDMSYYMDAEVYKQPEWVKVANDLRDAEQYDDQVLTQLDLASVAYKERDATIGFQIKRAQEDFARLKWSQSVPSDVALAHFVPNTTPSRILCDFLTNASDTQQLFLTHPSIDESKLSLNRQQTWLLQMEAHAASAWKLSKDTWFASSKAAKRSLSNRLKADCFLRVDHGKFYTKEFQKLIDFEMDAFVQLKHAQGLLCKRADREDAGEKDEMQTIKIGGLKMDVSNTPWYYGRIVRKGATNVAAYVKGDYWRNRYD